MNDYAAAPIQPIVQGLLTVEVVGQVLTPHFSGRGVQAVDRVVVGPAISYVLTLDEGLIGNAGEVQPGPPQPDCRTLLTIRGLPTTGATTITAQAVSYITPGADGGDTQVKLVFSAAGVAVDPVDPNADGVEIIIWKGL